MSSRLLDRYKVAIKKFLPVKWSASKRGKNQQWIIDLQLRQDLFLSGFYCICGFSSTEEGCTYTNAY